LHFHAHVHQLRQQNVEFLVAHQRLAAHNRDVHRPQAPHQREHAMHKRVAAEVGKLAQGSGIGEVLRLIW
jgi:hypothetical protein